jgi:TolB protein
VTKQGAATRLADALFVATLVGLVSASALPAQATPIGQARQFSHSINDSPSMAPDGRRMVFISVVAGHEQLFTRSIEGREVQQITFDAVDHEDPAWSPDGRTIAFVSIDARDERIARMPATGGAMEFLTPATERAIHPNWSPDGRRIAYCTDDDLAPPRKNDSDIKVIDVATGDRRVLITGGVNTYPAWSPDGRLVAFRRMLGQANSEVFVADSTGGNARNVTNHAAFDGWPSWSPDGSRLAFASNRNGPYQIFIMRPDGSDVQLAASTTGRATAPQWSRDGRTIYFPICQSVDGGAGCEIFAVQIGSLKLAP